jgi:hypothetical protein
MKKSHPLPSECSCRAPKKPEYRFERMVNIAQVIHPHIEPSVRRVLADTGSSSPIREYPPKVFGAAPAIVFDPHPDTPSIRRPFKARKPNRGWEKMQALMNGAADHQHGYDDGEYEPQTRGVHV